MIRHFITFLFLFCLSAFIYGQNNNSTSVDSVYYSDGLITISCTAEKCTDPSKGKNQFNVIVTITNHSNYEQEVSYYLEKHFAKYCIGCIDPEQQKVHVYTIPPANKVMGDCFEVASGLSFVSDINLPGAKSKLESFEFKNIQVIQK